MCALETEMNIRSGGHFGLRLRKRKINGYKHTHRHTHSCWNEYLPTHSHADKMPFSHCRCHLHPSAELTVDCEINSEETTLTMLSGYKYNFHCHNTNIMCNKDTDTITYHESFLISVKVSHVQMQTIKVILYQHRHTWHSWFFPLCSEVERVSCIIVINPTM